MKNPSLTNNDVTTTYEKLLQGNILKAIVTTVSEAESESSFMLIDLNTGESVELNNTLVKQNYFNENSTFEIGNNEETEELQIKINTKLSDTLEIE